MCVSVPRNGSIPWSTIDYLDDCMIVALRRLPRTRLASIRAALLAIVFTIALARNEPSDDDCTDVRLKGLSSSTGAHRLLGSSRLKY